jgi:hypothetical protein
VLKLVVKYSLEHDNNDYRFFFVQRPLVVAFSVYGG